MGIDNHPQSFRREKSARQYRNLSALAELGLPSNHLFFFPSFTVWAYDIVADELQPIDGIYYRIGSYLSVVTICDTSRSESRLGKKNK